MLNRWMSKWIFCPLKFQKDFDLWHQYIFQTWVSSKIHFKNPSFNKLSDKLFPFFWWRTYTGKAFYKKKKGNKESNPVILIISIKARKESEWLFSNTMYHLTWEVSPWGKTKNSGIKPNTIFSSALWLMVFSLQGHPINKMKVINTDCT